LGTGYSSITLATDNDYLRILGEVGLLGLLSFFLILANILKGFLSKWPFIKNFKKMELAFTAGLFSGIGGVMVNAFFIDIFEASKFAIMFWLFAGFVLAILKYEVVE
jgi:O-antigen ligase